MTVRNHVVAALGSGLDDQQLRVVSALLAMQRQSWEHGVASHALLDLGLDPLVDVMARDAAARQTPRGKLADLNDTGTVNCGSAGEAVLWAARRSGEAWLADAFERQIEFLVSTAPRAADGTLYHIEDTHEMWVDSVYMVVPVLVLADRLDDAVLQMSGHRERLFDEAAGLYGWRWDEDLGRVTHPEHWGTGNGWVVAGIARSLRLLGPRRPEWAAEIAGHARTVIDACLAHRADDGVFCNVVDDPATFSEANLAQMLAYGILEGVAAGWLPATYEDAGRSLVHAAREHVDGLGFVQGVCGSPHFDHRGTSVEAQSFFLLATNAEQRLDAH